MAMGELTPTQREAVKRLDRDVCVSAGAGSGKTRVLVERFCHIVESGRAGVGGILTVTFTEKAAREMKERIVRRFAELARGAEGELRRRREQDRRDVETAYIGTIHAFCARVLRENALEAGVDPRFSVLDAAAAETSRRGSFDDALAECHQRDPAATAELAEALGIDGPREAVLALHGQARRLGLSPDDLRFDAPGPLEERTPGLAAAVAALSELSRAGSASAALIAKIGAVEEAWRKAEAALLAGPTWETIDAVREVRGAIDKRGNDETKRRVEDLRTAADSVVDAIVGALAAQHVPALRALLESLDRHHRQRKEAIGGLDYDDLLVVTRDLLARDAAVAGSYRDKFKFVLMDEFQDTNRLQMEVIDAIRRPPPGNFFFVGDMKQSIFGFNDAEVKVFIDRCQAMERADTDSVIPLVENFRSRPELIGFVNRVCGDVWAEDRDFRFHALTAKGEFARDAAAAPRVEVIALPSDGASADDVRREEAQALAGRIRQLVGAEGEAPLRLTRADHQRDLEYRDILVLFRATTAVPIYERALFDAGIPYYVVSGRGFYATPEVQNLANLLRVAHQPLDDYALAAVLRSPLCEVRDDTLYWLAAAGGDGRRRGRLWRAVTGAEAAAELDGEQRERLLRLRAVVGSLQAMAPEARLSRMIDQAVEATDYGAKMLVQHSGKRRYANVRKLIEVAQQVEGSTGFGLGEFLEYLASLPVLAEREAEAPTEGEQSNVVRLMTIHMAKGLEAPVVCLADLSRALQTRAGNFLIDEDRRVAIRLRSPLTEEWIATAAHGRAVERIGEREREEYKRLFYVALTRAEERLILIGGFGFKHGRSQQSYRDLPRWSEWIEKAVGLEAAPEQERHLDLESDGRVAVSVRGAVPGPPPDRSRRRHFRDHYRRQVETGEPVLEVPAEAAAAAERAAARAGWQLPAAAAPPRRVSVTALLDYDVCPRLYRLRYLLHVPERRSTDSVSSIPLGLLTHEALARYDFESAPEGTAAAQGLDCDQATRARVAEMIDRLRGMEIFGETRQATERHPEIRFQFPVGETMVGGVLDLLYRGPGQAWRLLDYKTGELADAVRDYEKQVAMYAHAVAEITAEAPERVILVSLTDAAADSTEVDDPLLAAARREMQRLVRGIAAAESVEDRGEHCRRCPYAGRFCAS